MRKGTWQNLAKGKCPYCEDSRLERDGKVLACGSCDYYVTPTKLLQLLTDPRAPAQKHMSEEEKRTVSAALAMT